MENVTTSETNPTEVKYAGFWSRLAALIIDGIILKTIYGSIMAPLFLLIGLSSLVHFHFDPTKVDSEQLLTMVTAIIAGGMTMFVFIFLFGWLYFALMESSNKQATLGKMALQLKVTDMAGNKISFARASGRYFGKIISDMTLFIGYFMAVFTTKKQALHDMISECLVVKK